MLFVKAITQNAQINGRKNIFLLAGIVNLKLHKAVIAHADIEIYSTISYSFSFLYNVLSLIPRSRAASFLLPLCFFNVLGRFEKTSGVRRNRVDTWVGGGLEGASHDGPVGSAGRRQGFYPSVL